MHSSSGTNDIDGSGDGGGHQPVDRAVSGGGCETAFEDNDGDLYLRSSSGTNDSTGLGWTCNTSPSIAAQSNGGWAVAFEATGTDHLYVHTSSGTKDITGLGMASGTSPSITALPGGLGGGVRGQRQAPCTCTTQPLYDGGTNDNTGLGMEVVHQPVDIGAVRRQLGGGVRGERRPPVPASADGANDGRDWGWNSDSARRSWRCRTGATRWRSRTVRGDLYLYNYILADNGGNNDSLDLGMEVGTSPAIA